MPPTSIDGTDITGATIDGTDVTEITVDGQTVFTAQTLPVAYSNLVAWYPFDSAAYGGSNADDVTAILGGSGDDTAYDGTVNGATYQSSGGVTDISAGANSGGFDFDGIDDFINLGSNTTFNNLFDQEDFTVSCWVKNSVSQNDDIWNKADYPSFNRFIRTRFTGAGQIVLDFGDGSNIVFMVADDIDYADGDWHLCVAKRETGTGYTLKIDDDETITEPDNGSIGNTEAFEIGHKTDKGFYNGNIDDFRIYNKATTDTEDTQIYNNSDP